MPESVHTRSRRRRFVRALLGAAMVGWFGQAAGAVPLQVEVRVKGGRAELTRDGKDYFVHGVGGDSHLELLAACGGNSIRTWGVGDVTAALLDEAQKRGVSVTLGVWLNRTGAGMDYSNEEALARQASSLERAIKAHRKHPALLMWAIGNEMEGDGNDPLVYVQLERLAQLAHSLDPDHPTMTVIAEMGGGKKIRDLDRLAPSIDVIGINSYGLAPTVGKRYVEAGGKRPYMLTEFGARGHWESPSTPYGLPIEETSTAKAENYRRAYEEAVRDQPLCIGSYAFLWGDKQETTATWYGMLLPDGTRLGCVDVMTELWTGKAPRNLCPAIEGQIGIQGIPNAKDIHPGDRFKVTVDARDPERNKLDVEWVLRRASAGKGSFGQREEPMPDLPRSIVSSKRLSAQILLPDEPGVYRLFAYVRDGKGGGATCNVPLRVVEP
ncbi:hypothetical protein Poly30_00730 [Planctomycetes bacterium Poly30]|uniref:Glycoside hydrolase family 2 catalytic domain-containing protein n=1 Tax=Saltatorellus ferox TaxID=2528018 RepID=A0A518EKG3_9BACT|nr:hypothetical protein Poly30_00730 [Planctomycetes bacterium Poly30]